MFNTATDNEHPYSLNFLHVVNFVHKYNEILNSAQKYNSGVEL